MLDLGFRPNQRFEYYSSPDSQNMSNSKYFGDGKVHGPGHDILIADDCSLTDSNSQGGAMGDPTDCDIIRHLLRQHSEVTDLRELARDAGVPNNQPLDDAYLQAIRSTFGGCQAIEVESDGPIKAFPRGLDREGTGIGVYAPLRQRQGNIRIHDHMLNSGSSNSQISIDFENPAGHAGNCRTPHTPVRVFTKLPESVM